MRKMPSFDFSAKAHNMTYGDRVHKYTLNIPQGMWDEFKKRTAPGNEIRRASIYILAVLKQHLKDEKHLTMETIIFARKESERIASGDHRKDYFVKLDKSRRGIAWWLQKLQPKQLTFNFKR